MPAGKTDTLPSRRVSAPRQSRSSFVLTPLLSALIILAFAAVVYRSLLLAAPGAAYPLGCDTWGHLFKAQYLTTQLAQGNLYPTFLPWWYNGLELFRYYSPLPIYILSALQRLAGDIFVAGAWLVPAAAAFGGLSWLLYARRIGWLAALAAGVAWTVWPDHIWVALIDGNLPRVVATALLPLLFLSLLDSLEMKRWPWAGLVFLIVLQLIILCHAMIAAMVCVALGLFCLLYWLFGGTGLPGLARGAALLVLAVLASSWWLLPSLHGGITSISPAAVREAVLSQRVFLSLRDPRTLLVDLISIGLLLWVVLTWKGRGSLSKTLWVCAFLGVVITIPAVQPLYMALPLSHLMWPTRFGSLTAVALIGAFLAFPAGAAARGARATAFVCLGLAVLGAFGFSDIIRTGQRDPAILAVSRELAQRRPGWRVGLLDISRLTSQAAYDLSARAGREQVYGFAYQGAAIGPALVLINTALEHDDYPYAIDRAWQCGATDLVVAATWVDTERLLAAARSQGFGQAEMFGALALISKPARPQAFVNPYRILAVGRLSGIISMLFPEVESGRARLDSYTSAELSRYDTLFLSGVEWESQDVAEALVRTYARAGGRVVVDLTQFPTGRLNDRPTFLGVTGEKVSLQTMPELATGDGGLQFQALSGEFLPWVALVPQGLDQESLTFSYYGQSAAVLGTKMVDQRPVTFLGINLPYHAYLTRDPAAMGILTDLLGVEPGAVPARMAIPLDAYEATAQGYSFSLTVPEEAAGKTIILPFGAADSIQVLLDGSEVSGPPVESLIGVTTEPGPHEIRLRAQRPSDADVAILVSITTGLLIAFYVMSHQIRASARRKEAVASHDSAPATP